jgi:ferredoxin
MGNAPTFTKKMMLVRCDGYAYNCGVRYKYGLIGRPLNRRCGMKAVVDPDICMGCGVCETIAPEVFQLGVDGIARVIVDVIPPDMVNKVKEAVAECPEEAITIA